MDIDFAITAIALSGIFSFILLLITIVLISFFMGTAFVIMITEENSSTNLIECVSDVTKKHKKKKRLKNK